MNGRAARIMTALEVYNGSDGKVTIAYYQQLQERGPLGVIAMNLFRAQKCSSRAKKYRRRVYKGEAYDRKNWSMQELCKALDLYGSKRCGDPMIAYGWKQDPNCQGFEWVLYVDLPQGQVSFHSPTRGAGPDYAGEWDGARKSAERILAFCDNVMGVEAVRPALQLGNVAKYLPSFTDFLQDIAGPEHIKRSEPKQDSLFQTSGEGE